MGPIVANIAIVHLDIGLTQFVRSLWTGLNGFGPAEDLRAEILATQVPFASELHRRDVMLRRNSNRWMWMTLVTLALVPQFVAIAQEQSIEKASDASVSNSASYSAAVLLRKTGRVLSGIVEPRGESIRIAIAENSSVTLPLSQVQHIAPDLDGLYRFKLKKIHTGYHGDHYLLAKWCLTNSLLSEAADHYQAAKKLKPNSPHVQRLAVDLKNKMLAEPAFRLYLRLPPMASGSTTAMAASKRSTLPPSDPRSKVATVSYETLVGNPVVATQFAQHIQPILMNRCSQAACHGYASKNDFKLLELSRKDHRQLTEKNMKSVLRFVAADDSNDSALLELATKAHGIQPRPGIEVREKKLVSVLENWVKFVQNPVSSAVARNENPGNQVRTLGSVPQPLLPNSQLVPVQPGASGLKPVPQVNASEFPGGDVPLMNEIDALDRQLRQILGEAPTLQPGNTTPAKLIPNRSSNDAFDPNEFNRQSDTTAGS